MKAPYHLRLAPILRFPIAAYTEDGSAVQRTNALDLPPDLRDNIYHLALVPNDSTNIEPESESPIISEPALLSICKQVMNEALPVYYNANTFYAPNAWSATRFAVDLSPKKLGMIRALRAIGERHAVDLEVRTWEGGKERIARCRRFARHRVQRLVAYCGKNALREDAIQVPPKPAVPPGEVKSMTLAELKHFLAVEGEVK